jgi:hypothetical protein
MLVINVIMTLLPLAFWFEPDARRGATRCQVESVVGREAAGDLAS